MIKSLTSEETTKIDLEGIEDGLVILRINGEPVKLRPGDGFDLTVTFTFNQSSTSTDVRWA